MFLENNKDEAHYLIAKKRVEDLKKFYKHFAVYIIINVFISVMKIRRNINNGETFEEALVDFDTFAVWIFWGIAIAIQAFKLFGLNFLFGRDWEQRTIQKHMRNNRY